MSHDFDNIGIPSLNSSYNNQIQSMRDRSLDVKPISNRHLKPLDVRIPGNYSNPMQTPKPLQIGNQNYRQALPSLPPGVGQSVTMGGSNYGGQMPSISGLPKRNRENKSKKHSPMSLYK